MCKSIAQLAKSLLSILLTISVVICMVTVALPVKASAITSTEEEVILNRLVAAIENVSSNVNVSDLNIPVVDCPNPPSFLARIRAAHPEFFYLNSMGWSYSTTVSGFSLIYTSTVPDILSQKAAFQSAATAALSSVPSGLTDLEKVLWAHEYISYNVDYDTATYNNNVSSSANPDPFNAYGALVNKLAVCQGYGYAFLYLMNQLGIECKYVSGTGNGGSHGWNIVKINNKWYHVDTTWDGNAVLGSVGHKYLLVSNPTFTTGGSGRNAHSWDIAAQAPGLTATDLNDATYENLFLSPIDVETKLMFNPNNGHWYYRYERTSYYSDLKSYDFATGTSATVLSNWIDWSGAPNYGGHSYPVDYNGKIFYNEKNKIYYMNFDGTGKTEIVSEPETLVIAEMRLVGSVLYYKLKSGLNAFTTESVDLSTLMGIPVTSITLNKSTTTLTAGGTETLTATIAPTNATNKNVTWTSSNASVATVNSSGLVTAVAAGSAIITATAAGDTTKTATCAVTVNSATVAVTGISLNKTSTTITTGGTETLTATIAPTNATNKNVTWTSSNASVTTVNSSGLVTAVAAGSAIITATAAGDTTKTATCTVTVQASAAGAVDIALFENQTWLINWTQNKLGKPLEQMTVADLATITDTLSVTNPAAGSKVPAAIGLYTGIPGMYFYGTGFESVDPAIGNLSNLKSLTIYSTNVTSLPNTLTNLAELTTLTIDSNSKLTSLPYTLGNLTALTSLTISGNSELTSLPSSLINLAALTSLRVANNAKLTSLPSSFNSAVVFPNITTLSFANNALTEVPTALLVARNKTSYGYYNNQIRAFPVQAMNVGQALSVSLPIYWDLLTMGQNRSISIAVDGVACYTGVLDNENKNIQLSTAAMNPGEHTVMVSVRVNNSYSVGNYTFPIVVSP
jgi:uncharacterized protein YjdB